MAPYTTCLLSRSSNYRSQHFCDVCKYMFRMDWANGHNNQCSNCESKVYAYYHHCFTVHEDPNRLALNAVISTAGELISAHCCVGALIDNMALISRIQTWHHQGSGGTLAPEYDLLQVWMQLIRAILSMRAPTQQWTEMGLSAVERKIGRASCRERVLNPV